MSVNPEKLQELLSSQQSVHKKSNGEQIIGVQVMMVKTAIDTILSLIRDQSGSTQTLENHL